MVRCVWTKRRQKKVDKTETCDERVKRREHAQAFFTCILEDVRNFGQLKRRRQLRRYNSPHSLVSVVHPSAAQKSCDAKVEPKATP
ncbi:hypothetical protein F443_19643 [Phytophthora nicotianae P1569]|uniref:Uncharacterized protein n=1 Tax=Phytophthora nicotianae P1569 TaxID=1317065 RepID=V9E5A2_PHYNI|nr:hypothetical protein F443_19643 [Phytophthora nicotianae P1569]